MNKNGMEAKIQAPPAMEAFEQRLLLAGNVLAEITNAGDLVITGDDAANQIMITEVAGVVTILRGDADTLINGDADVGKTGVVIDGIFSRNVKIKMGDGDDEVAILGDDGVDPNDPADDNRFEIGGNVQIDLGAGVGADQEATLNLVDVAGSVKITAKDDTEADAQITNSTIGKNVQIALGGGDNYAAVENTDIEGNLQIQNKDGEADVYVRSSTVTGSVSISGGKGLYNVEIRDSLIGKNLSVKNKELVSGNPADVQRVIVRDTNIDGSVKISSGNGAVYIDIDDNDDGDTNGDGVVIGKKLSISSKDGVDGVYLFDTTAKSVKINTGKGGADNTEVYVGDVTITGSLSMANKSGVSVFNVDDTTVTKKTKLTGGKAQTTVDIGNLVATGGLQIKGGGKAAGVLDVMVRDLDGGKVSIQGGGDADVITLNNLAITSLQIKTDKGADIINIELVATGGAASTVGTLKLSTGDGDDTVTIGVGGRPELGLTLTGKGTFDGGKGTDTLDAAAARGNTFDEDLLTVKNFDLGDSIV